jgi:hypothetical protein
MLSKSLSTRLFNSISSTFKNPDDLKSIVSHLNSIFRDVTGNEVDNHKIKKHFSNFFGYKNIGVLDNHLKMNNPQNNHELYSYISDNISNIFPNLDTIKTNGEDFITATIPAINVKTKSGVDYQIILDVNISKHLDKNNICTNIPVFHEIYIYHVEEEEYIPFSDDLNFDKIDIDLEAIFNEFLSYDDEVLSITICPEIENISNYTFNSYTNFNVSFLLFDLSSNLLNMFSNEIYALTGKKVSLRNDTMNTDLNLKSESIHLYDIKL